MQSVAPILIFSALGAALGAVAVYLAMRQLHAAALARTVAESEMRGRLAEAQLRDDGTRQLENDFRDLQPVEALVTELHNGGLARLANGETDPSSLPLLGMTNGSYPERSGGSALSLAGTAQP